MESKEMSVPVTLNYKGGGIRLQDVASFVGLGWSLRAGGMVTRIVRGMPDESEKGYIGKNKTGVQVNGGGETNATRADKVATGEWDGEPDLFYISTPTGEFSFVFDENGIPVFNQPVKCKVSFERLNGPDDDLSIQWHLTDASGIHYIFGMDAASRENVADTKSFTSTWYLSKMYSFNKTDEITFDYLEGKDVTTTIYNRMRVNFKAYNCMPPDNFQTIINNSRTYQKVKYLSAVNTISGRMKLNYIDRRDDLDNGYALSSIEIYNKIDVDPVRKYTFTYDYFTSPLPEKERNRLCLKQIYTSFGKNTPLFRLYNLDYYFNPGLIFPDRSSASFDHWGFYNNNSGSTPYYPEADKEPVLEKTLQYSLRSIEHAQGGKTEFLYELNSYYDEASNTDKKSGGLRISAMKEYDNSGKSYTRSYEYKLDNGKSSGQVTMKNIRYIKYSGVTMPSPIGGCSIDAESCNAGLIFNISDINGVFTGYSKVKVIEPNGGYTKSDFTNFNDFPDYFTIHNSLIGTAIDINNIRQFGYSTSNAHKRGLLKSKVVFTSDSKPVSEALYEYGQLSLAQRKALGVSVTLSASIISVLNYFENVYYQVKDNYQLLKETEKIYDAKVPTLYLTKTKSYTYNPEGTLVRITSYTSSEGENYSDKVYYPENRSEIAGLTADETQAYTLMNDLAVPIREEHNTTDNNKIIKHSSYTVQSDGNPAHTKVFLNKVSSSRNSDPLRQEVDVRYDFVTGNVSKEVKRTGQYTSYLWSSDNKIIAKADYADNNEIYYQGFEEVNNAITGSAYAGRKYFSGSYTIPFTRPNGKKYILSYRKLVAGKWEPVNTVCSSDNMILNEPVPIDNIRIFPEGSQMTTYTHIPLIGITSVCDFNDNTQYYEYDEMLRLKLIRDLKGNILKQMGYQYSCDCFFKNLLASIEIRNAISEDDGTYASYTGDIYVVLRDQAGSPAINPNSVFNFRTTTKTQSSTSSTDGTVTFMGSELMIYSGLLSEYYFDSNGKPIRYKEVSISKLAGTGYN
ncbi:MAG TPA: hypothetical protein VM802_16715 [Chitinophaga sp.]|uniref:hypothetical protein n=1 Tax=Chitinophaga sp. TaxID=1869181 RepID=UPI002BA4215D|nr:hypothetical protein [Chitinophaga sp.]HVI46521.1 hypothetical protein [Chitinophaga sp.]